MVFHRARILFSIWELVQTKLRRYEGAYRRVATADWKNSVATLAPPDDWISYLDGMLHLLACAEALFRDCMRPEANWIAKVQ